MFTCEVPILLGQVPEYLFLCKALQDELPSLLVLKSHDITMFLGLDHILTIMFHSISLALPPFLAPFPWFTQPPEPWRCLRSWRVAPIATPARGWLRKRKQRSVRNWTYRGGELGHGHGVSADFWLIWFYMDFIWNLYGLHMILYDFIWFISPFSVSQNDLNGTFEGRGTPMVFDGILPCSKAIVFDSLRRFSHHGHGPGGALAGTGWPRWSIGKGTLRCGPWAARTPWLWDGPIRDECWL